MGTYIQRCMTLKVEKMKLLHNIHQHIMFITKAAKRKNCQEKYNIKNK